MVAEASDVTVSCCAAIPEGPPAAHPPTTRASPLPRTLMFQAFLRFARFHGLPLHVTRSILAARAQRLNVVDDIAVAGAMATAGRGAGVLRSERALGGRGAVDLGDRRYNRLALRSSACQQGQHKGG